MHEQTGLAASFLELISAFPSLRARGLLGQKRWDQRENLESPGREGSQRELDAGTEQACAATVVNPVSGSQGPGISGGSRRLDDEESHRSRQQDAA